MSTLDLRSELGLNAEDDDTQPGVCAMCAARAAVESAVSRARVVNVTTVGKLDYPRVGPPRERTSVFLTCEDGRTFKGEGESREEAMLRALESAGVRL